MVRLYPNGIDYAKNAIFAELLLSTAMNKAIEVGLQQIDH